MVDFNIAKKDDGHMVSISGALTIESASELRKILVNSISKAGHVVLEIGNVTEMDLSCLQLFYAAHKRAKETGKGFSLKGGCPDVFKKAVEDAGYLRSLCAPGCDISCL